jgi:hypothetical protein
VLAEVGKLASTAAKFHVTASVSQLVFTKYAFVASILYCPTRLFSY